MIRYSIIVLIILLYIVPFYQGCFFSQKEDWNSKEAASAGEGAFHINEEPFYSEDFINQEKPNTICHVSSIAPVDENMMVSTWYAGSREGARDVAIYFSIFDEKKMEWTEPVVLVDREQASNELKRYVKKIGNSLVFNDKNDRLWLFYASITFGGWSGSSLNYKVSLDRGRTWSKSRKMILSPFFNLTNNVKNKGINLKDGSFLLPVYHEFIKKFSQLILVQLKDSTISYEIRKMSRDKKAIQPAILHKGGKNLVAFFRNMGSEEKRYILMAHSDDLGQSWSGVTDSHLPNPNSGFDMIKQNNGTYLGVINNTFHDRNNLTLIISHDEGKTWKPLKILENVHGKEYSYPSIGRSKKGFYHITYTHEKRRIKHVVFNEAWIKRLDGYSY